MSDAPVTSIKVVLARLFWMLLGPAFLTICLYRIATAGTGWTTFADLVYFVILGGMILGRWVEFRAGNPRTSTGEPAAPADLRRYVLAVAAGGLLLWVVANVVGNHLLTG